MTKKLQKLAWLLVVLLCIVAMCSSCDDDDYDSRPPVISDVTFRMLADGSEDLRAGEPILVTAVQAKKGHLLLGTTYKWTSTPAEGVTHRAFDGDIYDLNPVDPTDTIVIANPGTYKLTLSASYKTSGSKGLKEGYSQEFADGNGRVRYEVLGAAIFHYEITAEKYIKVK